MYYVCVLTSLVFLSNAFASWLHNDFIYASCWIYMVYVSVAFHLYRNNILFYWLDQLAVFSVFVCGSWYIYSRWNTAPILFLCGAVGAFILSVYMYYVGRVTTTLCFSPDETEREYTHALLHYICSIGHHCCLLL
jgi:hypothetical protein